MSLTDYVNRKLSLRNVVQEFYSKDQPRDNKGQFATGGGGDAGPGKSWTGPSAHPDRRRTPKSSLSFPIEPDTYENQKEANMRFARGVFDADLGDGYSSRIRSARSDGSSSGMTFLGEIVHGGKVVGTFNRSFEVEKRGVAVAYHTELLIDTLHTGKGVGERFNAHAVAKYQEMGFDRIVTHAGDEVGGFAWARKGFRWGDKVAASRVMHNTLNKAQDAAERKARPHQEEIIDEIAAIRGARERGEDVQPIHIAAIGQNHTWEARTSDGRTYNTWAGKEAMLGANYEAVYYFDANTAVTAAAVMLELYDRSQPRNKDGEWTSGGGGLGGVHPEAEGVFRALADMDTSSTPMFATAKDNQRLREIQATMYEAAGYNGKARAVGADKFEELVGEGKEFPAEGFRAVFHDGGIPRTVDEIGRAFIDDPRHFPSLGVYGNGSYFAVAKRFEDDDGEMQPPDRGGAIDVTENYGPMVTRVGVPNSMLKLKSNDVNAVSNAVGDMIVEQVRTGSETSPPNPSPVQRSAQLIIDAGRAAGLSPEKIIEITQDQGRTAILMGASGYTVFENPADYLVVLNRGALVADRTVYTHDGRGGIKPSIPQDGYNKRGEKRG